MADQKDHKDQKGKKKETVALKVETARSGLSTKLYEKYKKEVLPSLMKKFSYSNVMEAPKIVKVVVNRGVGEATVDVKILDKCLEELFLITHQKPFVRKAKKSIANFKLRKGQPIGVMTTLRGPRMYHFLEKLIEVALPRIRDFKGLSPNSFDGRGNYTFGIREQLIFTEIDYNKVDKIRGMNVSIITTASNDESAKALLESYGLPFRNN